MLGVQSRLKAQFADPAKSGDCKADISQCRSHAKNRNHFHTVKHCILNTLEFAVIGGSF